MEKWKTDNYQKAPPRGSEPRAVATGFLSSPPYEGGVAASDGVVLSAYRLPPTVTSKHKTIAPRIR